MTFLKFSKVAVGIGLTSFLLVAIARAQTQTSTPPVPATSNEEIAREKARHDYFEKQLSRYSKQFDDYHQNPVILSTSQNIALEQLLKIYSKSVKKLDQNVVVFRKNLSRQLGLPPATTPAEIDDLNAALVSRVSSGHYAGALIWHPTSAGDHEETVTLHKNLQFLDTQTDTSESGTGPLLAQLECTRGLFSDTQVCRKSLLYVMSKLKIQVLRLTDTNILDIRITPECTAVNPARFSYVVLNSKLLVDLADGVEALKADSNFEWERTLQDDGSESRWTAKDLLVGNQKHLLDWAISTGHVQCDDSNLDIKRLMPNLLNEVAQISQVLPANTFGFHYQDQSKILWANKPASGPRDPQILEYIRSMTTRFWSSPSGGGSAGAGLYFAVDPGSSRDFGNTLLKVELKKGSRYFNYDRTNQLSKLSLDELAKYSCHADSVHSIYYGRNSPSSTACYKVARALTKELHIGFVIYRYIADRPKLCAPSNVEARALVVFDPSVIDIDKSVVETTWQENLTAEVFKPEMKFIRKLRGDPDDAPTDQSTFENWVKTGTYGCSYDPDATH